MTDKIINETELETGVNIVWLKRDLRLSDHEPLAQAIKSGITLLYYVFEPLLINDPHYDQRHWRFVTQSIDDLNTQLAVFNSHVYVYLGDAIAGLNEINNTFKISKLFSHEEVGLLSTYQRDESVKKWCQVQNISWHESPFGAVTRGKKNRIDWRLGVTHLAKLFLDFEPGIHYSQFQMQSGVTGTNIIRVYNPVKQSLEKDYDGEFLRKWLPELVELPNEVIHTPWLLSPMEQVLYQCQLGADYPSPMVDINETGKIARDLLWGFRNRFTTKKEGQRILTKHVRTNKKLTKTKKPQQLKLEESE